jgi:hypothetical protein
MKYIKKFNEELKSSTYYSAAKKTTELGVDKSNVGIYKDRARKFSDRGDEEKSKENKKEWLNILDDFKGKTIVRGRLNGLAIGNYYLSLEIDDDVVSHLLEEGPIEDGAEIAIWFYIGFVPADEETYETCSKYSFGDEIDNGIFNYILMAGITFEVNNGSYYNLDFYYHDHGGDFNFSQIKDYKALKNRFVVDIKTKFKDDIDEIIAGLGIGADYGIDFIDIYNFMKNYNVNDLIK